MRRGDNVERRVQRSDGWAIVITSYRISSWKLFRCIYLNLLRSGYLFHSSIHIQCNGITKKQLLIITDYLTRELSKDSLGVLYVFENNSYINPINDYDLFDNFNEKGFAY